MNAAEPITPPDAELVRRAVSGETRAFEVLVQRHFDTVHAIAWARLGQREAAEDLAQEVFLRAWLAIAALRDGDRFGPWVGRMTRNLAVNWQRTRQRQSQLVRMVPMEPETVEQIADLRPDVRTVRAEAERDEALSRAIGSLPAEDREIVTLHFMAGQTQREIADRLGTHHSTVSRRLERAVGQLRNLMGGAEPQPMSVGASPRARSVACGLAAAVSPEAVRRSLEAAAGSAPARWAAFVESLPVLSIPMAPAGAGVLAMSMSTKLATAVVAIAVLGGGGWYLMRPEPSTGTAAQTASVPKKYLGPPVAVGTSQDSVYDIPVGSTLALSIAKLPLPSEEIEKQMNEMVGVELTANADGTLTAEVRRADGTVNSRVLGPSATAPEEDRMTTVQVWQDANRVLVESFHLRKSPTGMQVAVFRRNRPELLPKFKELETLFTGGRISRSDLAARVDNLMQTSGLYPSDAANREQLRSALKKLY